jgi:hypothetical protein
MRADHETNVRTRNALTQQSTESPIFMPLFGQKTVFRARMREQQGDMQLKRAIQHATKTLEKMQQH